VLELFRVWHVLVIFGTLDVHVLYRVCIKRVMFGFLQE
jgi:hypothetical protein